MKTFDAQLRQFYSGEMVYAVGFIDSEPGITDRVLVLQPALWNDTDAYVICPMRNKDFTIRDRPGPVSVLPWYQLFRTLLGAAFALDMIVRFDMLEWSEET